MFTKKAIVFLNKNIKKEFYYKKIEFKENYVIIYEDEKRTQIINKFNNIIIYDTDLYQDLP